MIKNYFKIAWRNLLKNKVYSFINIVGLAIGMAVTTLVALWIVDELSFNSQFEHQDDIAQVYQNMTFNGVTHTSNSIPRPLEFALREKYDHLFKNIAMTSWHSSSYLKYGERNLSIRGNFMQQGILEMLNINIIDGNPLGWDNPTSIVLSQSAAQRLFGAENPIGKTVMRSNSSPLKVTAVYEDLPARSTFSELDFIIPWEFFVRTQDWVSNSKELWDNNSFQLLVQLADGVTMDQVENAISDVKMNASPPDVQQLNPVVILHPMKNWHLRGKFEDGKDVGGRIENVWLFGTIGIFVLLLACINFMNLSTARSEKRALEVGIRKSIGSNRGQLCMQFLSESLVITTVAFLLAMIFVVVAVPWFNTISGKEIAFPFTSLTFWIAALLSIVITAFLAGSYPALYLSSFQPITVLKGKLRVGKNAAIPRKILVITQFSISVALISGTLIVMQQINHSKNRPSFYEREGLIQIPTLSNDFEGKFETMRERFIASGAVVEMATSSSPATEVYSNMTGYAWEGKPEGFQEDLAFTFISYDYMKTLGIPVIEGREFSREFPSDTLAVLLNRTAVKYMGLADPIGTIIRSANPEDPEPPVVVVGVVEDAVIQSPYQTVKQHMYAFDRWENASFYNLRLSPDQPVSTSLKTIERIFKDAFPSVPYSYDFVDQNYEEKFLSEERLASLARMLTILAIIISCLGLFGLASFIAEQRTKEIGIRKVLGASVSNLWLLLSKDFVLLVVISLLIATPVAYYFMKNWIERFDYRINIGLSVFLIAGFGALFLALITVSYQTIKAAIANPVKSLRTE
ncbi:ABC transporter permease [Gangjinia marincola]|uniref:ABC transporter permease n=1 Tax=Gangjinia marincola TaxID=578463 RepID=A0ABP3XSU9_9FLAO